MLGWSSTTKIRAGRRVGHKLTIFCSEPACGLEVARPSRLTTGRESWEELIFNLYILSQSVTSGASISSASQAPSHGWPTSELGWNNVRLFCLLTLSPNLLPA